MKLDAITARKSRIARAALALFGAFLLAFGSLSLQACTERNRVDEATEEVKDEIEDAKDEIEDEVDDNT